MLAVGRRLAQRVRFSLPGIGQTSGLAGDTAQLKNAGRLIRPGRWAPVEASQGVRFPGC